MSDVIGILLLFAVWLLPLVVIAWFVWTLVGLRRGQAELLRRVAAIEGELRGRRP